MTLYNFSVPKYEKSRVPEERKTLSNFERTLNKTPETNQQGVPFPVNGIKDFDDWDIISDSSREVRIKKVTIFADYYIWAFQIVYEDNLGHETTSTHALDNSYLKQDKTIKKCELEIDDDDYINYISCAYSSQKTFIRSIRIATYKKLLLVHEGEIELKNQGIQEMMISNKLSNNSEAINQRKSKHLSKSAICNPKNIKNETKISMVCTPTTKSDVHELVSDEEEEEEDKSEDIESSFTLKRPSLVDFHLKTQSWHLGRLNLKVLGFKTYFNGYIEDIEVYAEPIEENLVESNANTQQLNSSKPRR